MKSKVLVLLVVLLIVGVPAASAGSVQGGQAIATGQVRYTRFSVCEHPNHPGVFLQYYLTDGCNHELFLYGSLGPGAVGSSIWAEGSLVENGSCKVLDVTTYTLCKASSPSN
jgi:hypothetical protein